VVQIHSPRPFPSTKFFHDPCLSTASRFPWVSVLLLKASLIALANHSVKISQSRSRRHERWISPWRDCCQLKGTGADLTVIFSSAKPGSSTRFFQRYSQSSILHSRPLVLPRLALCPVHFALLSFALSPPNCVKSAAYISGRIYRSV
jgi:hypothetical protein